MNTTKRPLCAVLSVLFLATLSAGIALPTFPSGSTAQVGALDAADRIEARRIILYRTPSGETAETSTSDA